MTVDVSPVSSTLKKAWITQDIAEIAFDLYDAITWGAYSAIYPDDNDDAVVWYVTVDPYKFDIMSKIGLVANPPEYETVDCTDSYREVTLHKFRVRYLNDLTHASVFAMNKVYEALSDIAEIVPIRVITSEEFIFDYDDLPCGCPLCRMYGNEEKWAEHRQWASDKFTELMSQELDEITEQVYRQYRDIYFYLMDNRVHAYNDSYGYPEGLDVKHSNILCETIDGKLYIYLSDIIEVNIGNFYRPSYGY